MPVPFGALLIGHRRGCGLVSYQFDWCRPSTVTYEWLIFLVESLICLTDIRLDIQLSEKYLNQISVEFKRMLKHYYIVLYINLLIIQ